MRGAAAVDGSARRQWVRGAAAVGAAAAGARRGAAA
jgi:hypothetical protein